MKTQDIVLIALFTAITVVLGLMPPITLGFIPVPITLQTLGVMLAGVVLGAKRGGLAMLLLVLLVAIGLPVLAGGRGGLGVLAGPTAGFVLGWVPGAFVSGLLAERLAAAEKRPARQVVAFFLAAAIGGIGVVYAVGIPWLAFVAGIGFKKAALGSLAFVPGDLAKAVVAALVARGVHRAYPVLPGR
ncbi:biotin transporter BioY [Ferruginivarius sediminum]|uniref:Biotin transporter n=1 Tax=Ferruginivarius sediminum TaxID=2661937 RepID=A0A369T9L1_9PROT|nr:biotin transporter BioY [Ferruginivarius sediminum]RDD61552.1 biotin transporter BioY [Ferruginivarius sediminum]